MNFSAVPSASVTVKHSVARTHTGGTVRTSEKRIRVWLVFSVKMNTELFFELMLNIHESATFSLFCLVGSHKNL